MMRLIHYTKSPIDFLEKREYLQTDLYYQSKPHGIWFSVEDYENFPNDCTWKEWCKNVDFYLEFLTRSYQIILNKDAKILHLKTKKELFDFTNLYRNTTGRSALENDTNEIQWDKVKSQYQGIIIAPYQWDCRLSSESSWYYGWDCSCGCIWDISCIKEFNEVSTRN